MSFCAVTEHWHYWLQLSALTLLETMFLRFWLDNHLCESSTQRLQRQSFCQNKALQCLIKYRMGSRVQRRFRFSLFCYKHWPSNLCLSLMGRFAGQPQARGVVTAKERDGGPDWPVADSRTQSPGSHQLEVSSCCHGLIYTNGSINISCFLYCLMFYYDFSHLAYPLWVE